MCGTAVHGMFWTIFSSLSQLALLAQLVEHSAVTRHILYSQYRIYPGGTERSTVRTRNGASLLPPKHRTVREKYLLNDTLLHRCQLTG